MTAVRELCSFHRRETDEGKSSALPPRFLSDMTQDGFHQAEDHYLNALTAYTKKQFFKVKGCVTAEFSHMMMPYQLQ